MGECRCQAFFYDFMKNLFDCLWWWSGLVFWCRVVWLCDALCGSVGRSGGGVVLWSSVVLKWLYGSCVRSGVVLCCRVLWCMVFWSGVLRCCEVMQDVFWSGVGSGLAVTLSAVWRSCGLSCGVLVFWWLSCSGLVWQCVCGVLLVWSGGVCVLVFWCTDIKRDVPLNDSSLLCVIPCVISSHPSLLLASPTS